MSPDTPRLHFDLVDPLSYLTELELRAAESETGVHVERVALELRPPPAPLIDPGDPVWRARIDRAADVAQELDVPLTAPRFIPWSRKAHELVLHARASGREPEALLALYQALFAEARDVGRVDVLVEVATGIGLDFTESKAVLDVDRYAGEVVRAAELARDGGVSTPPTIVAAGRRLEGFHNRRTLGTFLRPPSS